MIGRPSEDEYASFFGYYMPLVPEGDLRDVLQSQEGEMLQLLESLTEEQGLRRYAPGKWSLKEIIGHVTDHERIMSYRAMRIARGDTTPLPGYEQDVLVQGANFDAQPIRQLADQYAAVRQSTLALLGSLTDEAWLRKGTVSQATMSVRALVCAIIGHEIHHLRIVRERYLNG